MICHAERPLNHTKESANVKRHSVSMMLFAGAVALVTSSLLFLPVPATATVPVRTFHFTNYRVPHALQTWLTGINDAGTIVGWFFDQQDNTHGFALSHDRLTQIDDPSGTNTQVFGINSSGAVVGAYVTSCLEEICSEGFVYHGGRFTDVGPPTYRNLDDPDDAPDSVANAINDLGDVVGFGGDGFGSAFGFIKRDHKYETVKVPGANDSIIVGINKTGLATVNWATNTTFQASLYDGSQLTTIDVPGAKESFAGGISDNGDIVLSWGSVEGGYLHGALLARGLYFRFNDPSGRNDTIPLAVNDYRTIVGAYSPGGTHDIHVFGFIATY